MGCSLSRTQDEDASEQLKLQLQLQEVYVFVPGMRLPRKMDFSKSLRGHLSGVIIARLNSLRSRVVSVAEDVAKCKPGKPPGEASLLVLRQAVEDYLACLHGFSSQGSSGGCCSFCWTNQEDEAKETSLSNVQYELLSALHLLGIISLLEANTLLTPKNGLLATNEENNPAAVESLIRTAQVLQYGAASVWPTIPEHIRIKLPADIIEGLLKALQFQALAQVIEIQLGMAVDNAKATLAVKRRLACEQVKYWKLALDSLNGLTLGIGWGAKHVLFLKWKHSAAKAAAYYYHGLVKDEASAQADAATCFFYSEASLRESVQLSKDFSCTMPATKQPITWGAMKYLSDKIPRIFQDMKTGHGDKMADKPPELPDFPLSLQADEYELPAADAVWSAGER